MNIDPGAIGFLERLNEDTALQSELEAALSTAEDKTGAVVSLAAAKGFKMNRQGFEAARAALAAAVEGSEALRDSELEAVAGGFNPQPDPPGQIVNLARTLTFDWKMLTRW